MNVSLHEDDDELEVVVADEGQGLYEARNRDGELHLGLMLITRLATHCTFTAAGDGTKLDMVFSRPRHEAGGDFDRFRSARDLVHVFSHAA